jgi:DNA repair exonuclease SbcCD nuclease subunit
MLLSIYLAINTRRSLGRPQEGEMVHRLSYQRNGGKMIKIAHISDTHIRNLKYHYEYKMAFDDLYKKLIRMKPDCIVHTGDIAHTKTQLSPEFFQMCTNFLKNLGDIAPTYVILGNHDGNLKNDSREDAISPVVEALAHPDIHLLKDSGETKITQGSCSQCAVCLR